MRLCVKVPTTRCGRTPRRGSGRPFLGMAKLRHQPRVESAVNSVCRYRSVDDDLLWPRSSLRGTSAAVATGIWSPSSRP